MAAQPKIYATLAWGFDPDTWGAIGFSLDGVRNRLADDLRQSDGLVVTMGTMGEETNKDERGRLLGLHKLATRPVPTEEMVEPVKWAEHLTQNNGQPKWPFGLPILVAEAFVAPPLREILLPRLHDENLHRKLASNYELLTDDEAARVLALERRTVPFIWSSPKAAFVANVLSQPPKGPPPTPGQRTLTRTSGPAATYCFRLQGLALAHVVRNIAPSMSGLAVFKVGFSNDPTRRLGELNAYLPDSTTLSWTPVFCQWHSDEINAWSMEQSVFRVLFSKGAKHVKGEIFAITEDLIRDAFTKAQQIATRPTTAITVTVGEEEGIATSSAT